MTDPLEVALIGAGPTASSLLERLTASSPELLGGRQLRIHLIDPHRAGTGRVWRPDLHPGLWMNSMAEDVTLFTDDTVRCAGPIAPGPSLYEWAHTIDDDTLACLASAALIDEIRSLTPMTFPTRLVQSVYLDWFHRQVVGDLPPGVEIVVHQRLAVDVVDGPDGRQVVTLASSANGAALEELVVDEVVMALGHLDAEPDADVAATATFAARHGLVHLPPGHTAELDLSVLEPGADVIALGFGQAFTDLLVLVTEGRGGRFVDDRDSKDDGDRKDGGAGLRYEPSGREPILHVGSRRGVPYHSKINYRLVAQPAPLPRFFDEATIDRLCARGSLQFQRDVYPLVVKEVGWAYYHELFHAHPERTSESWDEFAGRFAAARDVDEVADVVASAVPDVADRFDIARIDRPLHGAIFESAQQLHDSVRAHVVADTARRTDPAFSADLGAFNGLLAAFGSLARLSAAGAFTPRSRVDDVGTWWFSFFMYYASGPPPERLRQLVALADAGIVRFIGASATVTGDEATGTFIATSASHPERLRASALIDARVATPSVSRTSDRLLRALYERGEVLEELVTEST